jgi:hypothetical protein
MTTRILKANDTQLNVILDRQLRGRFKAACALNQRSMLSVMVEFIQHYVEINTSRKEGGDK